MTSSNLWSINCGQYKGTPYAIEKYEYHVTFGTTVLGTLLTYRVFHDAGYPKFG